MRSKRPGCNRKVRVQKLKRRRRIHLAVTLEPHLAFESILNQPAPAGFTSKVSLYLWYSSPFNQ